MNLCLDYNDVRNCRANLHLIKDAVFKLQIVFLYLFFSAGSLIRNKCKDVQVCHEKHC